MSLPVTVIHYGLGNIGSICNMLKKVGATPVLASTPDEIRQARQLVLPGVGSFDTGMGKIKACGLQEALRQKVVEEKTPLLGICLGMQLLADKSEEGREPGLGFISGEVKKLLLPAEGRLKIPHMGWNEIRPLHPSPLLEGLDEGRFYFVHSYHFVCVEKDEASAESVFDKPFTSVVQKGNIYGVQFHPEKSHRYGLTLFKNFVEKCR